MAEMKLQVEIEAPIKKVFNYIADVSTHPQYATFVASIKFLTTKRIGVGVKLSRCTTASVPRTRLKSRNTNRRSGWRGSPRNNLMPLMWVTTWWRRRLGLLSCIRLAQKTLTTKRSLIRVTRTTGWSLIISRKRWKNKQGTEIVSTVCHPAEVTRTKHVNGKLVCLSSIVW